MLHCFAAGAILMLLRASPVPTSVVNDSEFHWVGIGDGALRLLIGTDWRLAKAVSFESEIYTVENGRAQMFSVYLGNNPDLASIPRKRYSAFKRGGANVMEYSAGGKIVDIVLMPHCGHDRYAWAHRLSRSSEHEDLVARSMRSLGCAP